MSIEVNAPELGPDTYADEVCPQTLPSSRLPPPPPLPTEVAETLPPPAMLEFARTLYERQCRMHSEHKALQKGNRRLARKRAALAARLEVSKARNAVLTQALHSLRQAVLAAGHGPQASNQERKDLYAALSEAQELITGGKL